MSETLTSASIKTKLQNFNVCAVNKGSDYISDFASGKDCQELFESSELMVGLIDSLLVSGSTIIPEGEVIGGKQASAIFDCSTSTHIGDYLNIIINSAPGYTFPLPINWLFTASTIDPVDMITAAAIFINSFYPQSYPFQASANGAILTLSGINYDAGNATGGIAGKKVGAFTNSTTFHLSGGTPAIYQADNCINNEGIQIILNKLCTLCNS